MAIGADSSSYSSGDPDLDAKRRLAMAMMQQGLDSSPIASPWQGVARIAQAMIGGYNMNNLATQASDSVNNRADALLTALTGKPASTAPGTIPGSGSVASAPPAVPGAPSAAAPVSTDDFLTKFEKGQEGFTATPKPDYSQTSIGYGTKAAPGQTSISEPDASAALQTELGKARGLVQAFNPNLSKPQEDALTDLTYNAGPGWMNHGLGGAVKNGNWQVASQLFEQYDHAGGQELPGLKARRQALAGNLLITGDQAPPDQTAASGPPGVTSSPMPNIPGATVTPMTGSPSQAMTPMPVGPTPPMGGNQFAGPGAPTAGMPPPGGPPPAAPPPAAAPSGNGFDPKIVAVAAPLLRSPNPQDRALGTQMLMDERTRIMNPKTMNVKTASGDELTLQQNPAGGQFNIDPVTGKQIADVSGVAGPGAAPAPMPAGPAGPAGPGAPPAAVPGYSGQPQSSIYAIPPPPPGANIAKYRQEAATKMADEMDNDRTKTEGAINYLKQSVDAQDLFNKPLDGDSYGRTYGDVIGPYAKPATNQKVQPDGSGIASMVEEPLGIVGSLLDPASDLQGVRKLVGRVDPDVSLGNKARGVVDKSLTALQQLDLQQIYGKRVPVAGINQQAAASASVNAENKQTVMEQLGVRQVASINTIQQAVNNGLIDPRSLDPSVIAAAKKLGRPIIVNGQPLGGQ